MTEWSTLYERFRKLSDATGREKSSSYVMNLVFSPDEGILVELGCYDISDWPRGLQLGPFKTEKEAFEATSAKVAEAEVLVKKQIEEDKEEPCQK